MMDITFKIPNGMELRDVARTFTAYLNGPLAFENRDSNHGPFKVTVGDDSHWQLDGTNDYWLDINEQAGTIHCRYPNSDQQSVIKTMVDLFNLRFNPTT